MTCILNFLAKDKISFSLPKKNQPRAVHEVQSQSDYVQQMKKAGDKLVLIDFFATWCGPCKFIAPYLEALAKKYAPHIVVLKVDIDENDDLARKFKIKSMPTFVFLRNNQIIHQLVGADPGKIEQVIVKLLA